MDEPGWKGPRGEAFERAVAHLGDLPDRPVCSAATLEQLRAALGRPLPEAARDAREVIAELAAAAEPGVVASASGRFFGFVFCAHPPAHRAAMGICAGYLVHGAAGERDALDHNPEPCWLSGTTWQGRAAMRISVSNWSTDEADVDRSVAAILRCAGRD
jgi:hypothetical protein